MAIATFSALAAAAPQAADHQPVRNIVLVHGAFADGSGWRGVYDDLTARGYRVSIVQNALTSFADDVAAARRVIARQNGPVILVGHSYGGTVITEVGASTSEVRGSHTVFMTQPRAVADVIDRAARDARAGANTP